VEGIEGQRLRVIQTSFGTPAPAERLRGMPTHACLVDVSSAYMARNRQEVGAELLAPLMWYTGTFVGGVATFGLPKIE